jgi:hypothetical protein
MSTPSPYDVAGKLHGAADFVSSLPLKRTLELAAKQVSQLPPSPSPSPAPAPSPPQAPYVSILNRPVATSHEFWSVAGPVSAGVAAFIFTLIILLYLRKRYFQRSAVVPLQQVQIVGNARNNNTSNGRPGQQLQRGGLNTDEKLQIQTINTDYFQMIAGPFRNKTIYGEFVTSDILTQCFEESTSDIMNVLQTMEDLDRTIKAVQFIADTLPNAGQIVIEDAFQVMFGSEPDDVSKIPISGGAKRRSKKRRSSSVRTKSSKKTNAADKYVRTASKHIGSDGVSRTVYKKGGCRYVKRLSTKTGTYRYVKV